MKPATLDYAPPKSESPEQATTMQTLKQRAIRGSAWTLAGYGTSQALKLGSNLVLARLLFPEAFGLMAIVNTFVQGLQMFSDIGTGPSIIHHRRGDEPQFLNTAWTLQAFRGVVLFVATCALGWLAAAFYQQPELTGLIPAAGCVALISGFNATALFTLDRHLNLSRRMLFDLSIQVCNIGSTILLAWQFRSVWALVGGNIFGELMRLTLSHTLLPGERNRFAFDRGAAHELFRFGRWIFIGTVLSFIVSQSDRLILGKLMPIHLLGLYAIALGLSQMIVKVLRQFSNRVLFPLYARLKEMDASQLRHRMYRIRMVLMSVVLPPICLLVIAGDHIVAFLYPDDYHGAGWMLQVLAAGAIAGTIGLTISPVLLAVGDSFRHMCAMAIQSVMMLGSMAVGYYLGGPSGVIIGIAISKYLNYPVNALFAHRYGVWLPALDAAAFGLCAVLIGTGMWLT